MSRRRKTFRADGPPRHLPGWRDSKAISRHRAKAAKKRRKWLQNRGKRYIRNRSLDRHHIPDRPFDGGHAPSNPWKLLVATSAINGRILTSRWNKSGNIWRCVEADPEIEWFRRINNPALARDWLVRNQFTFGWQDSHPPGTAENIPGESDPGDGFKLLRAIGQ